MLKYPPTYQRVATLALRCGLGWEATRLCEAYASTPRWRWVRRLKLERQILLVTLADECYRAGVRTVQK